MENEANLIGAKLQSLLNIPPIRRHSDDSRRLDAAEPEASGSARAVREEIVTHTSPEQARGQGRDNVSLPLSSRAWDAANVVRGNKDHIPKDQQKLTERSKGFRPHTQPSVPPVVTSNARRGHVERRNFPNHQEHPSRYVKSNSRISTQLVNLLNSDGCPKNLTNIKQKLVDMCPDDSKPLDVLFIDEEVVKAFSSHCIERLLQKSTKFPRAKYFCDLCNYHLDNVTNAVNHILNARHIANEKVWVLDKTLSKVPPSSRNHELSIHSLILEVMDEYGIDDELEKPLREGIVERVNSHLSGYQVCLQLFGSSLPGFGLKTSDVNMNIDLTKYQSLLGSSGDHGMPKEDQAGFITTIGDALNTFPQIENLRYEYKYMQIMFFDGLSKRECVIHLNNISGVLTAQLFAEYDKLDSRVRPLVVAFRHWAHITEVDIQDSGLIPPHAFTIMVLKHLQDVSVIPILTKPSDNLLEKREFLMANEVQQKWRTNNSDNLGKLWLSLLRKYAIEFPFKDFVISICTDIVEKKSDRIWNRRLSIEDPIVPNSNLSRSVCSNRIFDYVCERIKYAYHYFAIPRMLGGIPLYSEIVPLESIQSVDRIYLFGKPKPVAVVAPVQTMQAGDRARQGLQQRQGKAHVEEHSFPGIRMINIPDYQGDVRVHVIQEDLHLIHQVLVPSEYSYEFNQRIFQAGEKPPVICKGCGGEGHLKSDCPEEKLPRSSRLLLEPMSNFTNNVLSDVLLRIFNSDCLREKDIQLRQGIVADINQALKPCFPDAVLSLFGSSYNGFGLRHSDIDICLRFENFPIMKVDLQSDRINNMLRIIVERLRESGTMSEILAIPSAKVPIVKFKHRATRLEGDISLSNRLALRNTALLKCYTDIDPRIKVLGCFMKTITKLCDISDASKGSLSSYGYILMLIHFCQQHEPPVLPVLQKLPYGTSDKDSVDGIDASFFSDLSQLPRVWPGYRSNNESVAQLFLSFLNFYSTKFSFDTEVINIRQYEPMTRKSKMWLTDTAIAIEDPFDHLHNLGAGLSRRMGVYIVRSIHRFRDFFSCSIDQMNRSIDFSMHYLDKRRLRLAYDPPIDRQCRICNRIGHIAKSCTFAPKNDDGSLLYVQDEDLDERALSLNRSHSELESPSFVPRGLVDATTSSGFWPTPATSLSQQQRTIPRSAQEQNPFVTSSENPVFPAPLAMSSQWMTSSREEPKDSSTIDQEQLRKLQEGICATLAMMNLGVPTNTTQVPSTASNGFQFFGNRDDTHPDDNHLRSMIEKNPGVVFQLNDNEQNNMFAGFSQREGPFLPNLPDNIQSEAMGAQRSRFESLSEDAEDSILSQMVQETAARTAARRFGGPFQEYPVDGIQVSMPMRLVGPPPGYPMPISTMAEGFVPFPPPGYPPNPPPGYSHPPGYAPINPAQVAYDHNSMGTHFNPGPPMTSSGLMQQMPGPPMTSSGFMHQIPGQPVTSSGFMNQMPGQPVTSSGFMQQMPGQPVTSSGFMHQMPGQPVTTSGFMNQMPGQPVTTSGFMNQMPGQPVTTSGFMNQMPGQQMTSSGFMHQMPGQPVTSSGFMNQMPGQQMTSSGFMHQMPGQPVTSSGFMQQMLGPASTSAGYIHQMPGPAITTAGYIHHMPGPLAGGQLFQGPIRDGYGGAESLDNQFHPSLINRYQFSQSQQNFLHGTMPTPAPNYCHQEAQSPSPEHRAPSPLPSEALGVENEREENLLDQLPEFPVMAPGQGVPHPHAPMFVMGSSGQMLNQNFGEMSSHSYHLSHIHHGPMVSAVPVGMPPHTSNIQTFPLQQAQAFTTAASVQFQQTMVAQQYHQHQAMLLRQQQEYSIYLHRQHQQQQQQFLQYQNQNLTEDPQSSVPAQPFSNYVLHENNQ